MKELIHKAIKQIYNQRTVLLDAANSNLLPQDLEDAYNTACGYVWGYQQIGLISLDAAFDYIDMLARACEGE